MKIAVTAQGDSPQSMLDDRFGRAGCFMIYDSETREYRAVPNVQNLQAIQGAGIQSAATVVNEGCTVLITGHCGPKAFAVLAKAGVQVYSAVAGTVSEAVDAFIKGDLKKLSNADVDGHW